MASETPELDKLHEEVKKLNSLLKDREPGIPYWWGFVNERICNIALYMSGSKELLIDAIIGGVPIPMGGISASLTPFCGNQHNEDWKWSREALEKMDLDALVKLYETRRHP